VQKTSDRPGQVRIGPRMPISAFAASDAITAETGWDQ
jgi:hypothetical protein